MKTEVLRCLMLSVFVFGAFAQTVPVPGRKSSKITVIVKDEEGAVITNAFVSLRADFLERDNPKSFQAEMRTGVTGQTNATIPQGFYDVFVASTGFAPHCVKLRVRDKPVTLKIVLKVDKLMLAEYGDTFFGKR